MTQTFKNVACAAALPINDFASFVLGGDHRDIAATESLTLDVQTLLLIKEDLMRHESEVLPTATRKAILEDLMKDPETLRKQVVAEFDDRAFKREYEKKRHDAVHDSAWWHPAPSRPEIFAALFPNKDFLLGLRLVQAGVCLRNKVSNPEVKSPTLKVFKGDPNALKTAVSRLNDLMKNAPNSDAWIVFDVAIREGLQLMGSYPEATARLREAINPTKMPERDHLVMDGSGKHEQRTPAVQ